jgi:formyl-CoA transferase
MFGAFGILAALREREHTGKGQVVRTSLLASMIGVHAYQGTRWLIAGEVPGRGGQRHPSITPYGTYDCEDAQINLAVGSEKLWQRLAPLVGIDPDEPRFATNELRRANRDEVDGMLESAFRKERAEVWMARLDEAGVPAGLVKSIDQVYGSAQVEHLGLIDSIEHPTLGTIRLPGLPVTYSGSPSGASLAPPLLGQHTELVLGWLGL